MAELDTAVQLFLSIIVVLIPLFGIYNSIMKLSRRIGELEGRLEILHEKVTSLCKLIRNQNK